MIQNKIDVTPKILNHFWQERSGNIYGIIQLGEFLTGRCEPMAFKPIELLKHIDPVNYVKNEAYKMQNLKVQINWVKL